MIDLNRVKTIDISGIGDSGRIRDYMEKGILDVIVSGDYYGMGREAVRVLYQRKKGKSEKAGRILLPFSLQGKRGEEAR